jgi:hypothetical protein
MLYLPPFHCQVQRTHASIVWPVQEICRDHLHSVMSDEQCHSSGPILKLALGTNYITLE